MVKWFFVGLGVFAFLLGAGTARSLLAASFTLHGINDPSLRADVVFTYTPSSGKIDIDITNTSLFYDPRFTGFAFNVPDNVTGISRFSGPTGWNGLFDRNDINTPMSLGYFDIAGITGPNFGGGKPKEGIPRGSTFSFDFYLTGTNLNSLNEDSFLKLLPFQGSNPHFFAGRFQRTGIDGEGSDVAVAPLPPTLLLFASGLLGLVGIARKFRR